MSLSVAMVSVFLLYILGGFLLLQTDDIALSYQFLSIHDDPVFNALAAVSGITIGISCITLVFFALISQRNDTDVAIVLFFALVGTGFAAGLVRMSIGITIRVFVDFIP
jgi:hypothetical protein